MLKKVICAISGGVDSAVSAFLLKNAGYLVEGLYMKNWDARDEFGYCVAEEERHDAQYICDKLSVPLHHVSFERHYWNDVFQYMLREYQAGATPNPDVMCNKHIKFDHLLHYVREKFNIDAIATGHYARVYHCPVSGRAKLIRPVDNFKDQTLFLSQISQDSLRSIIFPIGHLYKHKVKKIAIEAGLERIARKKESMGICFIGEKNFKEFIKQYIDQKPGLFIDLDKNIAIGEHRGIHNYTIGERTRLSGLDAAYYVISKDLTTQNIVVVKGKDNPALYQDTLITGEPHWIDQPPDELLKGGKFLSEFRFQHIHPTIECTIEKLRDSSLKVVLSKPLRALTCGQFAVFYRADECLGSARINYVYDAVDINQRKVINS